MPTLLCICSGRLTFECLVANSTPLSMHWIFRYFPGTICTYNQMDHFLHLRLHFSYTIKAFVQLLECSVFRSVKHFWQVTCLHTYIFCSSILLPLAIWESPSGLYRIWLVPLSPELQARAWCIKTRRRSYSPDTGRTLSQRRVDWSSGANGYFAVLKKFPVLNRFYLHWVFQTVIDAIHIRMDSFLFFKVFCGLSQLKDLDPIARREGFLSEVSKIWVVRSGTGGEYQDRSSP